MSSNPLPKGSESLGWTATELEAAPVIGRLHSRILDLEDALDGMASRVMMFGGIQRTEKGEFWISRDDVLRLISEVRDAQQ